MEQIIDCDTHPLVRGGLQGLLPYLPTNGGGIAEEVRHVSMNGVTPRPLNRYHIPSPGLVSGGLRADAVPPSGDDPGSDPEFMAADLLDRYDIDAALLLPDMAAIWTSPVDASEVMSAMNRYFIDEWLPVDSRFKLMACIFPLDPSQAAAEIRSHKDRPQVAGFFMPLIGMLMGNPHYYPIYEAACEVGMPLMVHPTGAEETYLLAPALPGGLPATYAERISCAGSVAASNLASLVLSGTFDRFPTLKIIFAEYGFSWVAPLMWRMEREYTRLGATSLKKRPTEYVVEHTRYCTQPIEEPEPAAQMAKLMKMMHGEQTLMFSSDYPHWDTDDPRRVLSATKSEFRRRVFYENAKETFAGRV